MSSITNDRSNQISIALLPGNARSDDSHPAAPTVEQTTEVNQRRQIVSRFATVVLFTFATGAAIGGCDRASLSRPVTWLIGSSLSLLIVAAAVRPSSLNMKKINLIFLALFINAITSSSAGVLFDYEKYISLVLLGLGWAGSAFIIPRGLVRIPALGLMGEGLTPSCVKATLCCKKESPIELPD